MRKYPVRWNLSAERSPRTPIMKFWREMVLSQRGNQFLSRGRLPDRLACEERPHPVDVGRSLGCLAHCLDKRRKRVEVLANEPDNKVVVIFVKAETGKGERWAQGGL